MLTKTLIPPEYMRYVADSLNLILLVDTEIDWVDVNLGEIFLRALDDEVVWEQSQSACVGPCWLLGMLRPCWARRKLALRLSCLHLLLLTWWLNEGVLYFFHSFLFLLVDLLRSSRFSSLLLNRLCYRLRLSGCISVKQIDTSPSSISFLFDLFNHSGCLCPRLSLLLHYNGSSLSDSPSFVVPGGTHLIILIVLSVVLFISFSLIVHSNNYWH